MRNRNGLLNVTVRGNRLGTMRAVADAAEKKETNIPLLAYLISTLAWKVFVYLLDAAWSLWIILKGIKAWTVKRLVEDWKIARARFAVDMHYIEHMLSKTNEKCGTKDFDWRITSV